MMRLRAVAAVIAALAVAGLCVVAQSVPSSSAGYVARIGNTANTAAMAANFTCTGAMGVDKANAIFQYKLGETALTYLTGAADFSGKNATGTYRGTFTSSTASPYGCPRDPAGAYVLNGTNAYVTSPTPLTSPQTFSTEVWFKTSVASGKLIGFGNAATGQSGQYDRHVYLSTTGQLVFGVYNGGTNVITSPLSYNDNNWHHMVATMSSAGMVLYVDGAAVANNTTFTVAEGTTGYWRIGYDNQSGWPNTGANNYFTGQMRYAAAYSVALTAAQVQQHYIAGK